MAQITTVHLKFKTTKAFRVPNSLLLFSWNVRDRSRLGKTKAKKKKNNKIEEKKTGNEGKEKEIWLIWLKIFRCRTNFR